MLEEEQGSEDRLAPPAKKPLRRLPSRLRPASLAGAASERGGRLQLEAQRRSCSVGESLSTSAAAGLQRHGPCAEGPTPRGSELARGP